MIKKIIITQIILIFFLIPISFAGTIYVNPSTGNDKNPGTKSSPLLTLAKAVSIANAYTNGPINIRLEPGIYILNEKIELKPAYQLNPENRFIIEATIMPDDTDWHPEKMPVLFSTTSAKTFFGFDCSVGIMISTSHVTIRGLKFTGNPNPASGLYYPVGRGGITETIDTLKDLEISQCLFIGEKYSAPVQAAVLTDGIQTKIDHCIFYNCKNGVVFWHAQTPNRNDGIIYSIIYGAYQAGIWTARADSSFQFTNNVISNCNFAWVKNQVNKAVYKFNNSFFTSNKHMLGEWQPPDTIVDKIPTTVDLIENNIIHAGKIILSDIPEGEFTHMDAALPLTYLNLSRESDAYYTGAGLFKIKFE